MANCCGEHVVGLCPRRAGSGKAYRASDALRARDNLHMLPENDPDAPSQRAAYAAGERACCSKEQRFVIWIEDAGENGSTPSAVQAMDFEATCVDARSALRIEHQRLGTPRAVYGAKPPGLASRPRRLAHGKLPHYNFPRRVEPDSGGQIARSACRCGGIAPQFCQRGGVSEGRGPRPQVGQDVARRVDVTCVG
jgi:hypothetical protein